MEGHHSGIEGIAVELSEFHDVAPVRPNSAAMNFVFAGNSDAGVSLVLVGWMDALVQLLRFGKLWIVLFD